MLSRLERGVDVVEACWSLAGILLLFMEKSYSSREFWMYRRLACCSPFFLTSSIYLSISHQVASLLRERIES